jgi:hypothetical protein
MVSLETSHLQALGENFFHQSGLLKIYQDTRYGMDGFLISNLKFKYICVKISPEHRERRK